LTDRISRERELSLVITIVCAAEFVFTVTLPKASELGERLTSAERGTAKTEEAAKDTTASRHTNTFLPMGG